MTGVIIGKIGKPNDGDLFKDVKYPLELLEIKKLECQSGII